MPIPNTITRTVELDHPQEKVWAAISTPDGIAGWFGNRTEGATGPGDALHVWWDEFGADGVLEVKVNDPMSLFAYCWGINGAPVDDPRRTYVEFRLEPTDAGTRLTLIESGFAQLPDAWLERTYEGNGHGWDHELGDLRTHLGAA